MAPIAALCHALAMPKRSVRLFFGSLALLITRGVLLWVLVPVGVIAWFGLALTLRRRDFRLGSWLGWLDVNLVAALQRGLLRPFFDSPLAFTPWSRVSEVTHRIRLTHPA